MDEVQRWDYLRRRLVTARRAAGLTQTEVARRFGMPQSFVSKCELGERKVDAVELAEFARLYRRPVSYFLPQRASGRVGGGRRKCKKRSTARRARSQAIGW